MLQRINKLIEEAAQDPAAGIGKPTALTPVFKSRYLKIVVSARGAVLLKLFDIKALRMPLPGSSALCRPLHKPLTIRRR